MMRICGIAWMAPALLLFSMVCPVKWCAGEEIRIAGKVKVNPTISFQDVDGGEALTREIRSLLRGCGWFDPASSATSDYALSGTVGGERARFELRTGGAVVGVWSVPASNERAAAKLLVDAILEKLFRIRGLCHSRIAFCAETARGVKNIYACDIDGGNVEQITRFNSLCVEPCWFPGGESICYTKYGKAVTDVVQTRIFPRMSRRLVSFRGLNVGVSVSPDSRNMALILSPDHFVDLYVKPFGGGRVRRLTRGSAVEASPCWNAAGTALCFVSDESGKPRIYSIAIDGSERRLLPCVGSDAVTPDWSGDDQIVYATRVDGEYTLAVLNLKTGENVRATNAVGTWESPSWAPDNRQVVCKRSDGKRASLFVVDTWTGKARQLLATGNALSMPAWSRRGR